MFMHRFIPKMFPVTYYWINPFTTLATLLFSVGPHALQIKSQSLGQAFGDFLNLASLCFTNWASFFFPSCEHTIPTALRRISLVCSRFFHFLLYNHGHFLKLGLSDFSIKFSDHLSPRSGFAFLNSYSPEGHSFVIDHVQHLQSVIMLSSLLDLIMYVFLEGEALCLSIRQSAGLRLVPNKHLAMH